MRWGLGEKFGVVFSFAVVVTATESRLNSIECGSGGDAVENDLVPDFIFSEASGSGYGDSDGFLNN